MRLPAFVNFDTESEGLWQICKEVSREEDHTRNHTSEFIRFDSSSWGHFLAGNYSLPAYRG